MPKLTIGMAHFDDFCGLWPTIQSLRLHHAEAMPEVELLVVDNNPTSGHGKCAKDFMTNWVVKDVAAARYIAAPDVVGTAAPRNLVFAEASGDAVMCIDCHVLLAPNAIRRLLEYYDQHPDSIDLLSGPMLYDDLSNIATHFADEWRDNMWGTWGQDARADDIDGEPFDIPAMGLGLFSCRRDAWPGFNAQFRGFGGEEHYIHAKVRQAGGRCLCLPFLRWSHRFGRPEGAGYRNVLTDRVRNYIIGHRELGLPLNRPRAHFVGRNKLSATAWRQLVEEVDTEVPQVAKPPDPASLDALFRQACETPGDINEHCKTLRELASQCDYVVEFGTGHGVATTALLAGKPKKLVSVDNADWSGTISKLQPHAGRTELRFVMADSRKSEAMPDAADMLFIDTICTERQLQAELRAHASKVRKWIVLHDTQSFGETGYGGGNGMRHAVRTFCRHNCQWQVVRHDIHNHGLTVLSCLPSERPARPNKLGSNCQKVLANYQPDRTQVPVEMLHERLRWCTQCVHRDGCACTLRGQRMASFARQKGHGCPLGKWYGAFREDALCT